MNTRRCVAQFDRLPDFQGAPFTSVQAIGKEAQQRACVRSSSSVHLVATRRAAVELHLGSCCSVDGCWTDSGSHDLTVVCTCERRSCPAIWAKALHAVATAERPSRRLDDRCLGAVVARGAVADHPPHAYSEREALGYAFAAAAAFLRRNRGRLGLCSTPQGARNDLHSSSGHGRFRRKCVRRKLPEDMRRCVSRHAL